MPHPLVERILGFVVDEPSGVVRIPTQAQLQQVAAQLSALTGSARDEAFLAAVEVALFLDLELKAPAASTALLSALEPLAGAQLASLREEAQATLDARKGDFEKQLGQGEQSQGAPEAQETSPLTRLRIIRG